MVGPWWVHRSTVGPHGHLWGMIGGCIIGLMMLKRWKYEERKVMIWNLKMQLLIEVAGILKRRGLYSLLRFSQMLQNGQCFTVSVDNDPKHTVKKSKPYRVCLIVIKDKRQKQAATEGGCSKGTEHSICAMSMGSRLQAVIDWKGF